MNPYTYEVGTDEPLHPDTAIEARLEELSLSDCQYGCKLYFDPRSNLVVLGHTASYGCVRTREVILQDHA